MNFFTSVEKGNVQRVADLLKQGGENLANKPNDQGQFPLHLAAKQGSTEIIQTLLDHSAKSTCKDRQGWTPLHYAARAGQKDSTQFLLKQKIPIDEKDSWTPLHLATLYKHPTIIRLLRQSGANLEAVNPQGQTALHLACHSGHKQIIELLIEMGSRIDALDSGGATPFEHLNLIKAPPASPPIAQVNSLDFLSKDMKRELLYNDKYSDITFVFSSTKIPAHRCILLARAPELLTQTHRDSKEHVSVNPSMTSPAFKFLLEWIYTATIEIEEVDLDVAIELYKNADLYKLPHLKKFVYSVVTTNVDEKTARTVLDVAMQFKAPEIIKFCSAYIAEHMKEILVFHKASRLADRPVLSHEALIEVTKHIACQENPSIEEPSGIEPAPQPAKNEPGRIIGPAKSTTTKKATIKIPIKDESTKKEPNMAGTTLALCKALLHSLLEKPDTNIFQTPVSFVDYPFYPTIIKNPMDLGTIKTKLNKKKPAGYNTLKDFSHDVRLVFNNARIFNQCGSDIYLQAEKLAQFFEEKYGTIKSQLNLSPSFDLPPPFEPPESNEPLQTLQTPSLKKETSKTRLTKKNLTPDMSDVPIGKKLPARAKRNKASSKEDSDDDDTGFYTNKRKRSSDSDEDARAPSKKARPAKRAPKKEAPPKKKQKKTTHSQLSVEQEQLDLYEKLQEILPKLDSESTRLVIQIVNPHADNQEEVETDARSWTPETIRKLKNFLKTAKKNGKNGIS